MVLVDTSVWIEVFRSSRSLELDRFVDLDEIVTCLPVIQEVLQGFGNERAFRVARTAMLSFPVVENPLRQSVFLEAAELYRTARRSGLTIRSSADCLIATCALRNGVSVFHHDRDFGLLAKVAPLREQHL